MGTGLDLDLRHDRVLHNLGDDTDEAIARRLRPRLARLLFARHLEGKPRERGTVECSAVVGPHGAFDAARHRPSAQRVHTDAQQLGSLYNAVARHDKKLVTYACPRPGI